MRRLMNISLAIISLVSLVLPKKIYIQAQAMGTSTQMGRSAGVTLIINELSEHHEALDFGSCVGVHWL